MKLNVIFFLIKQKFKKFIIFLKVSIRSGSGPGTAIRVRFGSGYEVVGSVRARVKKKLPVRFRVRKIVPVQDSN
jgi:hypothetical protein